MPERMKRCPNMDCEDLGLRVPADHECRPYDPDAEPEDDD